VSEGAIRHQLMAAYPGPPLSKVSNYAFVNAPKLTSSA
jgi:hypothetical protein